MGDHTAGDLSKGMEGSRSAYVHGRVGDFLEQVTASLKLDRSNIIDNRKLRPELADMLMETAQKAHEQGTPESASTLRRALALTDWLADLQPHLLAGQIMPRLNAATMRSFMMTARQTKTPATVHNHSPESLLRKMAEADDGYDLAFPDAHKKVVRIAVAGAGHPTSPQSPKKMFRGLAAQLVAMGEQIAHDPHTFKGKSPQSRTGHSRSASKTPRHSEPGADWAGDRIHTVHVGYTV